MSDEEKLEFRWQVVRANFETAGYIAIGAFLLSLLFGCAPGRDTRELSGMGRCEIESGWSGIPDETPMLKCPNEKPPKLALQGGKLCAPGDDECDPGPTASWGCVR